MRSHQTQHRIGIYAGAFNPVHSGHIGFALQALTQANLDKIYFLPERQPRNKPGAAHFGHRVAMLNRAVRPHRKLKVLEFVDTSFSVVRTLPQLERLFEGRQLVFLFGSDAIATMPSWPNVQQLFKNTELLIGLRGNDTAASVQAAMAGWAHQPPAAGILQSFAPHISSGQVREALLKRQLVPGLLKSVERYSDHNWLYVSVA